MPKNARYILALDSAVNGCGVCVYDGEKAVRLAKSVEPMMRGQAEALIPLVEDVIIQSGIDFSAIDLIATTIGPGTFSGLRVGLSAAKSYALALEKPLYGFSTLEVIALNYANNVSGGVNICVLIESKRQDFYFQLFDHQAKPLSEPRALSGADVAGILKQCSYHIIGDGCGRFMAECQDKALNIQYVESYDHPDPETLARRSFDAHESGTASRIVEPLYLRGADVSQPKVKPRILEASK